MTSSTAAAATRTLQPTRVYRAGEKPSIATEFRLVRSYSHLLFNLIYRDLTVRYKRSFLGFFWTLLNPLLLMIIFVIVFSAIFRFEGIIHYETYFLSEYLPWMFFSQTTMTAMAGIAWNGALMKRVPVPKSIFAIAATVSGAVNLLLSLIPLFAIMLFAGAPLRPALLFLPVSVGVLALFTFGVALALSSIAVFFTDIREMYGVAVTALMYLTPIIYPLSIIPERFRWIIALNPLTYLLEMVRDPIYKGTLPSAQTTAISLVAALVALLVGWLTFRRLSNLFYAHL